MSYNQKDVLLLSELYKRYKLGYTDFDESKELVLNSSDNRLSYLFSVSDNRMKFELIICALSILPFKRKQKVLNPYTEYVKFIKALEQNLPIDVLQELYFLANEQIKIKYEPIGTYEITRLL